jgi:peptidoglycan/xylan/chitin deacetylase (PgdA/CDA1 family)
MKRVFTLVMLSTLLACTSPWKNNSANRNPQQAATEYSSEEEIRNENTFKTLISQPEGSRDQEFARYLRRQMGFFYIGQGLVTQFDQELEKLYQQKMKTPEAEVDQRKLEEIKAKLYYSWEFFDRNLQELSYIYARLLEEAGTNNSPFQEAATHTLHGMNKFFDEGWKQGDQMAVLTLAQEYAEIGHRYKAANPDGKTPSFVSYYAKKAENDKEVAAAHAQSLKHQKLREKRYIDRELEKDWSEHLAKRKAEAAQEAASDRQPNTDVLFPSPGGNGQITGNMFKPGYWALTFDDGPHPTYTQGMLDAMNSGNLKGTFFWLSQNIKQYPQMVPKAAAQGFKRGSHSYTHANLPKLGSTDLNHEINDAYDVFKSVVGQPPTMFRCPYGACGGGNSTIRKMIADKKMMHVFWNVDSLDWQDSDPNSIFQRAKKQMEVNGKGIVLFHDIHPQSVKAVQLLVNWLVKEKSATTPKENPTGSGSKDKWVILPMDRMIQVETADSNSPSKSYSSP